MWKGLSFEDLLIIKIETISYFFNNEKLWKYTAAIRNWFLQHDKIITIGLMFAYKFDIEYRKLLLKHSNLKD